MHPRRRGVKIFDFAVAVGEADLEAQRASNLSPSNGRALPGTRWAAAQTRKARCNKGTFSRPESGRFLPGEPVAAGAEAPLSSPFQGGYGWFGGP